MKSLKLIVKGKVQGVFYRATALELATKLHLNGFAMNLPDGDVHIEVEGEHAAIEEFINWCRKGHEHARVDEILITEQGKKDFKNFSVKYYYA